LPDVPPRPIKRILIANRGEIALRIMKACGELGIETVAVYGDDEDFAPHVRYADRAHRIVAPYGSPYLATAQLVEVAKATKADAVHPGYGFLAENTAFARAVAEAGLILIGPSAEAIATMGDKIESRRAAIAAGVRPVPGTSSPIESVAEARHWMDHNGYPVAVKASGGGGGRGFRVARSAADVRAAFEGSRGEAERYFSNPAVYLERYLDHPRHVEVQVFGDHYGKVVALGERDCSIQRRHQKLVEESPSPAVSSELRQRLLSASVALASSVSYVGAGTIEYLLDSEGEFFFLEMNTRIQVEHTVTEMVTGIDLVKEQVRVASGDPLSFTQDSCAPRGWAIECRINAEDAGRKFTPAPGTISHYREPTGFGVRVDGAMQSGDTIMPMYDSLIAKLIVWGRDREEAIARMRRALDDFEIGGIVTTIPFHIRVFQHESFLSGQATTTFLDDFPEVIPNPYDQRSDRFVTPQGQERAATDGRLDLIVEVNGQRFQTTVSGSIVRGTSIPPRRPEGTRQRRDKTSGHQSTGDTLTTSVQGTVIRIAVEQGASVDLGDLICVVEAMKMENEIVAHRAGQVASLDVSVGDSIAVGTGIATIVSLPS